MAEEDFLAAPAEKSDAYVITKKFTNSTQFSQHIEKLSMQNKQPLIDTLLEYCDDNDIGAQSLKTLVNQQLKDKIQNEAIERGLMRSIPELLF